MLLGKLFVVSVVWCLLAVASSSVARADVKVSETVKYYRVNGKTGTDVVSAMARRGPRSGFLARAIAQTWYSPTNDGELVLRNGVCSVRNPGVRLEIRFTFPILGEDAGTTLQQRWKAFMRGVIKHEGRHADLARQMAAKMDRTMTGFKMTAAGGDCRAAKRDLARRLDAIWKEYDLRQNAFDKREHRRGGEVDKLVRALKR